jgi:hypothetical protein
VGVGVPYCHVTSELQEHAGGLDLGGVQDMDVLYGAVSDMRVVPFDLKSLSQFVLTAVTPLLPLIVKYARIPEQVIQLMQGLQ